jgi:hypothetical protein
VVVLEKFPRPYFQRTTNLGRRALPNLTVRAMLVMGNGIAKVVYKEPWFLFFTNSSASAKFVFHTFSYININSSSPCLYLLGNAKIIY